jgi:hypothetical protein
MDKSTDMTAPCLHFRAGCNDGGCELGRRVPQDCGPGCAAYAEGLSDAERTPCEIWTRVMGYHRPISAWNAGKQAEHRERRSFREPDMAATAGGRQLRVP